VANSRVLIAGRLAVTASSILMMMAVVPVTIHSASLDAVRSALAIFIFISLCTLEYFRLLYSYLIASAQIGAPYSSRGSVALLYIVCRAPCVCMYVCMHVLCMYVCIIYVCMYYVCMYVLCKYVCIIYVCMYYVCMYE
jgi:hypothetical protein